MHVYKPIKINHQFLRIGTSCYQIILYLIKLRQKGLYVSYTC